MIVNYTENGWEVITQRAHGLLAAEIAANWKHSIRTERWTETLLAIAEHDDAQVELERDNLLTAQGGPVDFKMKAFEERHCTQTMNFALSKSRYIGLLSSMHLDFVYSKDRSRDKKASIFLNDQKELRRQLRKDLGLTIKEAEGDYRLMEWCDALSLLLCQHENQPEARSVEISEGPDKKDYRLLQIDEGLLTVKPWPFESDSFDVYFETRLIPQLTFKNSDEFRSAFRKAKVVEKRWSVTKDKR
ncbi:DUF3891 family protein [Mucilaginibacter myungsuensis]|uniref:DUF3891 family protein n=1 Tax=Mucilaginibacter myungsuensis TaxID=649104 RepID=A0A929KWY8_9SPHI|nr:DUF3891 family protein [Mucilaginibacter myungsuensis]MBE9663174.1 DUF3891 family protein [Mucilaginibacter myungsuensis]MDN3598809.1 DUF3891 family protein [Mucilaginibacter myungsuensis]